MTNLATRLTASLVIPIGSIQNSVLPGLVDPTVTALSSSSGLVQTDFTGSGSKELFWQNTQTGDTGIWVINGSSLTVISTGNVPASSGWSIVGFAELTSDGKTDILWENKSTGDIGTWSFDANGNLTANVLSSVGSNSPWQIQGFIPSSQGPAAILWKDTSATDPTKTDGIWIIEPDLTISPFYMPYTPVQIPLDIPDLDLSFNNDLNPSQARVGAYLGGAFLVDAYTSFDLDTGYLLMAVIKLNQVMTTTIGVGPMSDTYPNWSIVDLGNYDGKGITEPMFRSTSGDYGYWQITITSAAMASVNPVYLGTVDLNSGWQIVNSTLAEYT